MENSSKKKTNRIEIIKNMLKTEWKLASVVGAGILLVILLLYLGINFIIGVNVYYNGEKVAAASTVQHFETYRNSMDENLLNSGILPNDLYGEYTYKPAIIKKSEADNFSNAARIIVGQDAVLLNVLTIDDRIIGAMSSERELERILDEIKEEYVTGDEESVDFVNEVKISESYIGISEYKSADQIKERLLRINITTQKKYVVEQDDDISVIAEKFGMNERVFKYCNPDFTEEMLEEGQEINVICGEPYLKVKTVRVVEETDEIPFETETKISDEVYLGGFRVEVEGEKGERRVKRRVTEICGVRSAARDLESRTLKRPKKRVIVEGTKPLPEVDEGSFVVPLEGRLTSDYGLRGDSTHSGIDLAAPEGTEIKACADGIVVLVKKHDPIYGIVAKVDHGNGFETLYAHMSDVYVEERMEIKQGEVVGVVGQTGYATGNHLHLEIRYEGCAIDPKPFLEEKKEEDIEQDIIQEPQDTAVPEETWEEITEPEDVYFPEETGEPEEITEEVIE